MKLDKFKNIIYNQEEFNKSVIKFHDQVKPNDMIGNTPMSGVYNCPYCLASAGFPEPVLFHVEESHPDNEIFYVKHWELSPQEQIQALVNHGLSEEKSKELNNKLSEL